MAIVNSGKLTRADGSIVAVVESMFANRTQFLKLRVVEDSDWLSVEDMWTVYTRLGDYLKSIK